MLQRTLALAENGLFTTTPNPRVGCVICKDGRTIAEGWHKHAGGAHAEVNALAKLNNNATGTDVYVSLEPCNSTGKTPPCTDALLAARPARVVIAMTDPNPAVNGSGIRTLQANGIMVAVADAESAEGLRARALNAGFISRMRHQRPHIRLKIAATADGKTALDSGISQWISNAQSRLDAHRLRAQSCAILTGIGTALTDNPRLTVRDIPTTRQPLRVLVDSNMRAPANLALFADNNTLVATAVSPRDDFPAETIMLKNHHDKVDLQALMRTLAARGINELTVEAGRKLNGALLKDDLVDEIVLYTAPRLFGGGKDMFAMPQPATPQDAPAFCLESVTPISGDVKIVYRRAASA